MKDIQASCSFCHLKTDELKLVRENGGDLLACYTCRQYRRPTATAIQALERPINTEVSYAIR